ncbi:hypothetical protein DSL64_26140 [Dyadobacter luteus]|uniref:Cytoplasmic protein n=1 Tax=Dyadobacter luteus TaxID=2259619 RepID=A0A3D8Y3P9_9BACT|nr:DUF3820 family protein [Dyadobacter luteus]REA56720.1 hypothetical protein DSL64_26140 [Dyadobacter luteus]
MENVPPFDSTILKELITYRMPFGKHKGQLIIELPVSYLEWFEREGLPQGKLGVMLNTMYEIRLNGLMFLIDGLKARVR